MAILFFDSQRYKEIAQAGGHIYRSGLVTLTSIFVDNREYTLASPISQAILQIDLEIDLGDLRSSQVRFFGSDSNLQTRVTFDPNLSSVVIFVGNTEVTRAHYRFYVVDNSQLTNSNYFSIVHTPGAAGSIVVRDAYGDVIVSYSGDTRGLSSSSNILKVSVDSPSSAAAPITKLVVLADTSAGSISSWTKELTVTTLTPSAAGDVTQWSVSGASTVWQAIDEATSNGDTDYAYTGTTGQRFLVNLTDLPTAKTGYLGVLVKNIMRRDDTATWQPRAIVKVGGTEYSSATDTVTSSSYVSYSQIWETSPATGTAWTASEINALQSGASSS
jgi:hypothetical protein